MPAATSRQTVMGAPYGWQEDMSLPQQRETWKSTARAYLAVPLQLHNHLLTPPQLPAPTRLSQALTPLHLLAPTQSAHPVHRVVLPTRLPARSHQAVLPTHLLYLNPPPQC